MFPFFQPIPIPIFQVVFGHVLQDLVDKTHCPECGLTMTPNMTYSPLRMHVMFFCDQLYKVILAIDGAAFQTFTERYWRGNPHTWKDWSY